MADDDPLAGVARDATTLGDLLKEFERAGYTGQFAARDGGLVECLTCKTQTLAAEITNGHLRRLEGASDPDDMLAVVVLTCPSCGTKGTLVLTYGPEASPTDSDVLREFSD